MKLAAQHLPWYILLLASACTQSSSTNVDLTKSIPSLNAPDTPVAARQLVDWPNEARKSRTTMARKAKKLYKGMAGEPSLQSISRHSSEPEIASSEEIAEERNNVDAPSQSQPPIRWSLCAEYRAHRNEQRALKIARLKEEGLYEEYRIRNNAQQRAAREKRRHDPRFAASRAGQVRFNDRKRRDDPDHFYSQHVERKSRFYHKIMERKYAEICEEQKSQGKELVLFHLDGDEGDMESRKKAKMTPLTERLNDPTSEINCARYGLRCSPFDADFLVFRSTKSSAQKAMDYARMSGVVPAQRLPDLNKLPPLSEKSREKELQMRVKRWREAVRRQENSARFQPVQRFKKIHNKDTPLAAAPGAGPSRQDKHSE